MATITMTLQEYDAAAKPFASADYVTIIDTGYSFADLSASQVHALSANNVDVIDSTSNVMVLSTEQYTALGPIAFHSSDVVILRDYEAILRSGTIEEYTGLGAKGVQFIDAHHGKVTFTPAQYAALGPVQVMPHVTLQLEGTSAGETLYGRAFNDTLKGFGGHDKLYGGTGNDKLYGGLGRDVLTSGTGEDVFVFDTKPNKKLNLDRITDFNVKSDSVYLDNAVFKTLGKGSEASPRQLKKSYFTVGNEAKDRNDFVIHDRKKGVLYYDADGSGSKAQVEIATLTKGLKMTYSDFFVI